MAVDPTGQGLDCSAIVAVRRVVAVFLDLAAAQRGGAVLSPLRRRCAITVVVAVLGGYSGVAGAVSFLSFDPRSMAMGGSGVASARSYNATFFNPALLVASQRQDDWKLFFRAYAGARLLDRDNFLDALDDYQDSDAEDRLDERLDVTKAQFQAGQITARSLRDVADAAALWQRDIDSLSNKPLRASISYGFSLGSTRKSRAWGVHYRRYYVLGEEEIEMSIEFNARCPKGCLLIGGEVIEQASGGVYTHINPATGKAQADVPLAGVAETESAIAAAVSAFAVWRAMSGRERSVLLGRFADLIKNNAAEFQRLAVIEGGTPFSVAAGGAGLAEEWTRYYAGWADKLDGQVVSSYPNDEFIYTLPEPYGVMALWSPGMVL